MSTFVSVGPSMLEKSLVLLPLPLPVEYANLEERNTRPSPMEVGRWLERAVVDPTKIWENPEAVLRYRQILPVRNACAPKKASLFTFDEVDALSSFMLLSFQLSYPIFDNNAANSHFCFTVCNATISISYERSGVSSFSFVVNRKIKIFLFVGGAVCMSLNSSSRRITRTDRNITQHHQIIMGDSRN